MSSSHGGAGSKRGASAVSGSGLALQGPSKGSRPPPAPAGRPSLTAAPKLAAHLHAALLPPQLRGRSNVGTEDLEKMFGKQHFKAKAKQ
ncbi:MAG: hypothetical protein WDW38_000784 [Sanguina aurantia]